MSWAQDRLAAQKTANSQPNCATPAGRNKRVLALLLDATGILHWAESFA